jgi:hypothetical protein
MLTGIELAEDWVQQPSFPVFIIAINTLHPEDICMSHDHVSKGEKAAMYLKAGI